MFPIELGPRPTVAGKVEGFGYNLPLSLHKEPPKEADLALTPITASFDGHAFLANGIIRDPIQCVCVCDLYISRSERSRH